MRFALWFRTATEISEAGSVALFGWLHANALDATVLDDGPIIVNTDLRILEPPPDTAGPRRSRHLTADLSGELWCELAGVDALWCADLTHLDPDAGTDCGAPLDAGGHHRETVAGGPLDGAGDDGTATWEIAVPFVIATAHGGPYDTDVLEAGYWLGRIDCSLQAARPLGVADLVFPAVPIGLLPQLELQGMYRGFPIVTHEQLDTPAGVGRYCTVVFTRGTAAQ